MRAVRTLMLILGPFVMVATAYAVSMQAGTRIAIPPVAVEVAAPVSAPAAAPPGRPLTPLQAACERSARELRTQLSDQCSVISRPPFVIAGDVLPARLQQCYEQTILPVAHVLAKSYFTTLPDQPIRIVLFASERSYREYATRVDGPNAAGYYGYFQRADRRIVANRATGDGTLAHELTHALSQFDFPNMPEWFDEGLASLHEESEFAPDGQRLIGLHNWRLRLLQAALRRDRLPSLDELFASTEFRGEGEGLHYAMVRYLCLYLQDHDLLVPFYVQFRDTLARDPLADPTGRATLCTVTKSAQLEDLNTRFRTWLQGLSESK